MKQEHKQLLFKDLCARIPYGVIVHYKSRENEGNVVLSHSNICHVKEVEEGWWSDCKPYLRPLSSMTDEEAREIAILHDYDNTEILSVKVTEEYIEVILDDGVCSTVTSTILYTDIVSSIKCFDYLNKKMFDFRGLIPKDLAIEVTEENNPYKY